MPAQPVPSASSWRPCLRLAALALVLATLNGCAAWRKVRHMGAKVETTPAATAAARPDVPATVPVDGPVRPLSQIINEQLQHGHYDAARGELQAYLRVHPDSALARSMLQQVQADPRRWLGPAGAPHRVQPGESYGALAQRYLGDARLFVILARYNGAADPSRLQAGQTVQVPARRPAAAPDEADSAATPPPSPSAAAADLGDSATPAQRSLALQREALDLLEAGRAQDALAPLDRALALDPGLHVGAGQAGDLRARLVSACHERAIVLYRDQQLEPAIALWDRVLTIDPGYEPAVAYRARAKELQRRLRKL